MIVTIDGPAGTGKSTAARNLAERLGFEFLNTGAMYRAVALVCLERRIAPRDAAAVGAVPLTVSIHFRRQRLWLDDRDVTDRIREADVTEAASLVASNPDVRAHLVALQRQCAVGVDLVTEGRDQGTVVFPNAECKIFLTASAEERTRRRLRELEAQGRQLDWNVLLEEIRQRDERDETRECAPLKPAADAVVVDSSDLTADEVLEELVALVNLRRRT
ncbi:MAG: (d)CMP kinase [Planctomycetaceae bacterium]|nr:(d)CMP kinase [Planctomycetaceae bacterium]